MVFRFWASSSSEAREAPVQFASAQHPGVLALIEDAAATKRGILFATQDQVVVSGLQEPADALVVSRQIQHGMQGFRGKAGTAPVAVSIVIDFNKRSTLLEIKEPNSAVDGQEHDPSSSEKRRHAAEVSHELITLLAIAKPAQVLITHDLLQQIAAIKGLALKSFPGRFGVYEYMWTAEDKLDLLQSEPQLTLAAFPSAPLVAGGTVEQKQGSSPIGAAEIAKQVSGEHESNAKFTWQWPKWVPRPRPLVLGGIGAAAIVLISVVGLFSFRGHPSQPVDARPPATAPAHSPGTGNSSPQASASPSTASAPAPAKGTAPTVPSPDAKNVRQKPGAQPPVVAKAKPAPPPSSQPCTLPGEVGKYASLAERKREQGDYRSAVRIFRQVLDCDPNNAQARDGLSRAIQAEEQSR
ncbi:MAG: hypothetical protein P4K78_00775 [Terracidiphilus sp.]|nr:hypothetical protein [Terracidiphilus sp.]